jgi:hypothetical protein
MVVSFRSLSPARLLLASTCAFIGLLPLPSRAQVAGESGPTPTGLVTPREAASGKRFFWCAGLSQASDLDAYVATGFDTLVVPLEWRIDENGDSDTAFDRENALAKAGVKRGLKIIFSLPGAPLRSSGTRISADSPSYSAVWTTWAQEAIGALEQTPNLQGWMLPDDARALVTFDDAGFRRYLQTRFASIDALNQRWNTDFQSFEAITVDDVMALAVARQSPDTHSGGSGGSGALAAPNSSGARPSGEAGFHPAALFLADWKRATWTDLVTLWAATIRGADARHLVLSGACPDYAQLLAMPEGVDLSVASVAPTIAENDIVTSNPQSLDIARHAGTRSALARFSLAGNADLPPDAVAQLLPRWVDAAIAHGSRGVAFSDFRTLAGNAALLKVVSQTLKRVKNERDDPDAPIASFAILLEPLAEGASPQLGDVPAPRGLYGFGEGLVSGEPSNLVASLRWGTAFGGADFLSPDDLSRVDLSRYSTILAPQLLDCSPETAQKLGDYVRGGGVLVADLGLGALQNGGSMSAMPPSMALLAGGAGPFAMRDAAFNVRGAQGSDLLPTWGKMLEMRPGMVLSSGDGRDATAFDGPTGFAPPPANATVVASGSSDGRNRAALSLASAGSGFFAFAPFRLWANWRPGQNGFEEFHGDLLARGANLAIPIAALTPFSVGTDFGSTRFPEVVNRPTSLSFLNHSASGQKPQYVSVDSTGTGDWLWTNALVHFSNTREMPLGAARPAPIEAPDDLEKRARPLSVFTVVSAGGRVVCRQRPVAVQNRSGGSIAARINIETPTVLALSVWGDILQMVTPVGQSEWQPLALDGTTPFHVTVVNSPDGYRCPPGSRHRVSVREVGHPDSGSKVGQGKAAPDFFVVADASGRLRLEFSGNACNVQIQPDVARR